LLRAVDFSLSQSFQDIAKKSRLPYALVQPLLPAIYGPQVYRGAIGAAEE
jgi:hypothetical protein